MGTPTSCKKRKLCSLGTGEVVHILNFKSRDGCLDDFERIVQETAHGLYNLQAGISDVRVCHPHCGEVCFVLTFLSEQDCEKFKAGPQVDAMAALRHVVQGDGPDFTTTGCLMPEAHTLTSLLAYLKNHVKGQTHESHDVNDVRGNLSRWFPRAEEYKQYVHWDLGDKTKYTRNLIFSNEHMDVLLMCWPAGAKSAIHSHDDSSCWVALVEGQVWEVQYDMPKCDLQFMEKEEKDPTGAMGRCSRLRVIGETKLTLDGSSASYANDEIGVHRIENRSDKPAYTLHVYAPGLRKMKLFQESGAVCVVPVASIPMMSEYGTKTKNILAHTHPDGILDADAWNTTMKGRCDGESPSSGPSTRPTNSPPTETV